MKDLTYAEFITVLTDIVYDRTDGICEYIAKDLQGEPADYILTNLIEYSFYKYWVLYTSVHSELINNKKAPVHSDYYVFLKKYIHTDKELKKIFETVLGKLDKRFVQDENIPEHVKTVFREVYEIRFKEYDAIPKASDPTNIMSYFDALKNIFMKHIQEHSALSNGTLDILTYGNRVSAYFNNTFSMVSSRVYYHPTFIDKHRPVVKLISTTFFFFVILFLLRHFLTSENGDVINTTLHHITNGVAYMVIGIFVLLLIGFAIKIVMKRNKCK
ncbi:hypothetical protein NXG27_00005 [Megasphaera paucivorans]|uniref:Uncharacterized protein n=1 Tax=Megasphaera paucivorans TaxID=349095 RepID=A0A1G9PU82_9FIRM|nr:hypothetical protein [Megasphaera paucivorans]SDM02352.1 hypothetical protein SAMN05660299_00002 [Megasphaera paucivorans]